MRYHAVVERAIVNSGIAYTFLRPNLYMQGLLAFASMIFLDLDDAREKVEEWRTEYNEVRPHSAIGDRTPLSLIHLPRQDTEALNRPEILT